MARRLHFRSAVEIVSVRISVTQASKAAQIHLQLGVTRMRLWICIFEDQLKLGYRLGH